MVTRGLWVRHQSSTALFAARAHLSPAPVSPDAPTSSRRPVGALPADLRIIAKKLARNKYKSLAPFVDDLCTIVANCKKFNLPGSFYHVAADKLSGVIEKALGKYWPRRW